MGFPTAYWFINVIEITDPPLSFEIGTVSTVPYDTPATVTNSGTYTDIILDFEIPQGEPGGGGGADERIGTLLYTENNYVTNLETVTSSIDKLDIAVADKVAANAPITAGTHTKITYDAKGLILSGTTAFTSDIAETTNKRYVTDADLTTLSNTSGTNTGDQDLSGLQNKVVAITVATAAGTAAKTATLVGYSPAEGDILVVQFTKGNTVNSPTLNINGTGALNINLNGLTANTTVFTINANARIILYHGGTDYLLMGSQRTSDSNVSEITTAEIVNGASTTNRGISGRRMRYAFDNMLATPSANGTMSSADKAKLNAISGTNTGDQAVFSTISVSGQSDVVADNTSDALTFIAGTGVTITTDSASDSITFSAPGAVGTVTNVSVATANGVSGSVANSTSTPAITLSLGDVTPSSVAASGTITGSNLSGTNTGDQDLSGYELKSNYTKSFLFGGM